MADKVARVRTQRVCAWCDQPLARISRNGCGAIWERGNYWCWWQWAINRYGLHEAVAQSRSIPKPMPP